MPIPAHAVLMAAAGGGGGVGGHAGVAAWVTANSADVLAYYQMDDAATSGTMADSSGNSRNGTYHSAGVAVGTIDGEDGCDFNGSSGFAYVTDAAWLDSIVGIFAVINYTTGAANQAVASRDGDTQRQWQWRLPNSNNSASGHQLLQIDGANPTITTSAAGISAGARHTIGVYSSAGTVKLYLDGAAVATTGSTPAFETGTQRLAIGKIEYSGGGQYFDGVVASMVFLSAADDASFSELHDAWIGA